MLPFIFIFFTSLLGNAGTHCDTYLTGDFADTIRGFESMRSSSGLIQDTIWISQKPGRLPKIMPLNSDTSLTNIGVDILIQAETKNLKKLKQLIQNLKRMAFHQESGLFFSWYDTKGNFEVKNFDVSAIDNLHLALALWTVAERFSQNAFGQDALQLFNRMDFSTFLDMDSMLVGGNLRFYPEDKIWIKDSYNFSNWGSEARLLYSLGWALNLFKKLPDGERFYKQALGNMKLEIAQTEHGEVLKLWDGALFQLYFPKVFINEEIYSSWMGRFYSNTSALVLAEGERRGFGLPAAHSAGRGSYQDRSNKSLQPSYKDKSGLKILVSEGNQDVNNPEFSESWESLFTSYSLFLAASSKTREYEEVIAKAHQISRNGVKLYLPGHGWMDSVYLGNRRDEQRVIPAQLALNQGMIALSLLQMADPEGLSLSARALNENPKTRRKLKEFYRYLDQLIELPSL